MTVPVLIVGGGGAGLTTSLQLSLLGVQFNHELLHFEQDTELQATVDVLLACA